MSAPLCFIDTETTGVHPDRLPWEIAMIRRSDDGTQLQTSFFVAVDLDEADPYGLSVGRFYERHPLGRYLAGHGTERPEPDDEGSDYLSPTAAAEMVARYTHGAHLVGAVPDFDATVCERLLRERWLLPAWHYHLIDVETLAVGWLRGAGTYSYFPGQEPYPPLVASVVATVVDPPWDSDELSRVCGVEPASADERHTALGDARWAMRLYDRITGVA